MSKWKNRIVGRELVSPEKLVPNPENWRKHPVWQRRSIGWLLSKVGWVQDVVVNVTTGHLLDGHMRVEEALKRGEETVPVLYVKLTPEEERLVLATFDPIAEYTETDTDALENLTRAAVAGMEELEEDGLDLLETIAGDSGISLEADVAEKDEGLAFHRREVCSPVSQPVERAPNVCCPFYALDVGVGPCRHNCAYCATLGQRGSTSLGNRFRPATSTSLKKLVDKAKLLKAPLELGAAQDPAMREYGVALRETLRLAHGAGLFILFLTKNPEPIVQAVLDTKFPVEQCLVKVSFGTFDDDVAKRLEPGAPPPSARLKCLREAWKKHGIEGCVHVSPMILDHWRVGFAESLKKFDGERITCHLFSVSTIGKDNYYAPRMDGKISPDWSIDRYLAKFGRRNPSLWGMFYDFDPEIVREQVKELKTIAADFNKKASPCGILLTRHTWDMVEYPYGCCTSRMESLGIVSEDPPRGIQNQFCYLCGTGKVKRLHCEFLRGIEKLPETEKELQLFRLRLANDPRDGLYRFREAVEVNHGQEEEES